MIGSTAIATTTTTTAISEALTCPACTFANAPHSAKCAVCDTVLPVQQKPGSLNAESTSNFAAAAATDNGAPSASFYPGTLFRFPLRTTGQAAASMLRREASTPAQVAAILEAFAADVRGVIGAGRREVGL